MPPSLALQGAVEVLCFLPDMPLQGEDKMQKIKFFKVYGGEKDVQV